MATLRIRGERLGGVLEIRDYLHSVEDAYNNLYVFDLITSAATSEDTMATRGYSLGARRKRVSLRAVRRADYLVLPEERLQLTGVVFESPGFWEFAASLNPLEVIRKYLSDRHEQRKDLEYRNRLEAETLALENERLKTDVVKARVDLLREVGVPEERIRQALLKHVAAPLGRLDRHQDSGLVRDAELIDTTGDSEGDTPGTASAV